MLLPIRSSRSVRPHTSKPMPNRDHRDLAVWQRAVDLAVLTHVIVDDFTLANRIAYGAQLRRAAVSIAANIAEGAARRYRAELIQHLSIARGSLAELQTHRVIVGRLSLAPAEKLNAMDDTMDHVARMLTSSVRVLSRTKGTAAQRPGRTKRTGT